MEEIMAMAESDPSADTWAEKVGVPLTKGNLDKLEQYLEHQQKKLNTGKEAAKFSQHDQKKIDEMQGMIENGVDPRSAEGQQFRAEHKKGSEHGDIYSSLSRKEAALFRQEWMAKKLKNFPRDKN